jgi:hypothetical protein
VRKPGSYGNCQVKLQDDGPVLDNQHGRTAVRETARTRGSQPGGVVSAVGSTSKVDVAALRCHRLSRPTRTRGRYARDGSARPAECARAVQEEGFGRSHEPIVRNGRWLGKSDLWRPMGGPLPMRPPESGRSCPTQASHFKCPLPQLHQIRKTSLAMNHCERIWSSGVHVVHLHRRRVRRSAERKLLANPHTRIPLRKGRTCGMKLN